MSVAVALNDPKWIARIRDHLDPQIEVTAIDDAEPAAVEFLVTWHVDAQPIDRFPRLKAVMLSGAGYDHVDLDRLGGIDLVRLVDAAMSADIASYVLGWVIHFQRDFDRHRSAQRAVRTLDADRNNGIESGGTADGETIRDLWLEHLPATFPRDMTVGVLGAGSIGRVVLDTCRDHGFGTLGWSRSRHDRSLLRFFAECDVVVCLVPLTSSTRGLVGAAELAALDDGVLINVARGAVVDVTALLDALDGNLRAAVLDVFEVEPLPFESDLWRRDDVYVTPHIAGRSDPVTAAPIIAANIERLRRGERPGALVTR